MVNVVTGSSSELLSLLLLLLSLLLSSSSERMMRVIFGTVLRLGLGLTLLRRDGLALRRRGLREGM